MLRILFRVKGYFRYNGPMEAGDRLAIRKPSFWKPVHEFFDVSGGRIGTFRITRPFTYRKAEAETRDGAKYVLSYLGWTGRRAEIMDDQGTVIGTMHRNGWWGQRTQLILHEKEYVWRVNGWGTRFFIEETDGTTAIEISGCGGFGTKGQVDFFGSFPEEEAFLLIVMGLYQMRLYEMEVSAASGAGAVVVLSA